MNAEQAAANIETAYFKIANRGDIVSFLAVRDAMTWCEMTTEQWQDGIKYLHRHRDDVLAAPILYPGQYTQAERDTYVIVAGQPRQTFYFL
ncbi:hypothetical protein J2S43_007846 [Catenuloplanes nepalensis]|uniref:Uncharacterized protein n=1 Tax=Catenuloplanes nepalensis TaxID=587533 RepID=A0ABT9N6L6_9ACTN|nr:hypothetical protein [Catenuloplanes nepalensis]MDP9799334.1 hypothetical protein [Catenuloplanes nepalensis]